MNSLKLIRFFHGLCLLSALYPASAICLANDGPPTELESVELGKKIEAGMNRRQPTVLDSNFDVDGMLDKVMRDGSSNAKFNNKFREGFKQTFSVGKAALATGKEVSYKFLRFRQTEGAPCLLFRLIIDGGLDYQELQLGRDTGGRIQITDSRSFASGEWVSATVHRGYLSVVADGDRGFLSKLLDKEGDVGRRMIGLAVIQKLYQAGQLNEAMAEWNRQPDTLKKDRTFLLIRLMIASKLSEEVYRGALADFVANCPDDPAANLILVTRYELQNKPDEALAGIDRLEKSIGGDPYLKVLRANIKATSEKYDEAVALLQRAIEEEPSLVKAYWALVSISLRQRNYVETVRMLKEIEMTLHIPIGDPEQVPLYADFCKSKEYFAWKVSRAKQ